MEGFKHTIPTTMQTVDMATGTVQKTEEVRWGMMPPAADKCQVCAVAHEPHLFHDCRSLFYQYAFYGRQRRWPTWADTCAHCEPLIVDALKDTLASNNIKWSEPPDGVAPIAHLGETEAPAPRGETPVPADALLQPGQDMEVTHPETGVKTPAKVLAVVPKGMSVEHAIADQNGRPRTMMVDVPRHRSTLYVIEMEQPGRDPKRIYVPQRDLKKGLADGAKLSEADNG
jgi:hypothetical protein